MSASLKAGAEPATEAKTTGHVPAEHRRTFVWTMGVAIVTSSLGDVALKRGVSLIPDIGFGSTADIGHSLGILVGNLWLVAGIVLMVIHFVAFVRALRLGPLSLVVPLRSTTYIITTLLAKYYLLERVTWMRWGGIVVILVGVSMVGWSGGGADSAGEGEPHA